MQETYKERLTKALKGATVKRLIPQVVQWTEPGQMVIGKIQNVEEVTSKKSKEPFRVYHMEGDECLYKFTLGAVCDRAFEPEELMGRILAITFKGMKDLGDGRRMREFDIVDLTDPSLDGSLFDETEDSK